MFCLGGWITNRHSYLKKREKKKRGRINCIGDFYRLILSALHWSFDSSLSGCAIGNTAKRLSSNSLVSWSNQVKALSDLILKNGKKKKNQLTTTQ